MMAVALNGVIHQIPVKSGPGAMEEFSLKIRELFNIGPEAEIDVSFVCKVPCGSGVWASIRPSRSSWDATKEEACLHHVCTVYLIYPRRQIFQF